jgi:hypothetical protein
LPIDSTLQDDNPTLVKLEAAIKEIQRGMGPPKFRAAHGQWVPYAWVVRGLVEKGHGVVDAVRAVVERANIHPPDVAIRSIRAAYYKIRTVPWPADSKRKNDDSGITDATDTPDDFEV